MKDELIESIGSDSIDLGQYTREHNRRLTDTSPSLPILPILPIVPSVDANVIPHADLKAVLSDRFGRKIQYLRISVTDRCDLRCQYCLPEDADDFEPRSHWLSFAQIVQVVASLVPLGLKSVRITGGEPLTRPDLPNLISKIKYLGVEDIALTTNGTQLAKYAGRVGTSRFRSVKH